MKTVPGIVAVLALTASAAFARDDLGSFADARAAWPDAFVPGKVAIVDFAGEGFYAFAGEAESFFPGEMAESDAELYEEATLDAKARFYATMSGGDASRTISLSGLRVAYRWAEGPLRRVVCVVPRRNVAVSPPVSGPEPLAPVAEPVGNTSIANPPSPESAAESAPGGTNAPTSTPTSLESPPAPAEGSSSDEIPVDAKIRACREGLAETPDDPFLRLRLARLFAQSGQASRATRHYNALVKRLASDRNVMPVHDAAAAMVEAAEHARMTGDEAQALKFYRSAWKLGDSELQSRITAAIALLRLHVD